MLAETGGSAGHAISSAWVPEAEQIEQLVTLTEAARSHKTLWQDEPSRVQEDLRSVLADLGTSVSSSRLQQYVHSSLGRLVVMANSLEGTLPQGITTSQTLGQMEAMATNPPADLHTPAKLVWDAEGGKSGAAGKQQMEQGRKAVLYLQRTLLEPFGRQLVLEAFRIVMQGAVDGDGRHTQLEWRSHPACSPTGFQYTAWEEVPQQVDRVCDWFNSGVANRAGAAELAAGLYYNLVVVHPFGNGNGRLCRLLASTAFQRVGLPFAVLPDNGHSKSRQQFQQAWQWADRHVHDPLKHLEVYMLQCLLQTCLNLRLS